MILYNHIRKLVFQIIFFITAVIEVWLLSGIIYGWASIAVVFEREGFFQHLCSNMEIAKNGSVVNSSLTQNGTEKGHFAIGHCPRKSKRFNLIFSVSLVMLCSTKFPIGLFIDRFGPKVGQIVGW